MSEGDSLPWEKEDQQSDGPSDSEPTAAPAILRHGSQREQLIALGRHAELFRTPEGEAYATVEVAGHFQTHALRSRGFKHWLTRDYFLATRSRSGVGSQAMQDAVATLEAVAVMDGPERPVHVRVAHVDGRVYVDLADDRWQVAVIEADGFKIKPANEAPVKFRRSAGMLALPEPDPDGCLDELQKIMPGNEEAFVLGMGWAVGAIRDNGPQSVLAVRGEHGSGKSTFCRMLRSLIDPNQAPIRRVPREDRDVAVAARNSWLLCYDNISTVPQWLSDTLAQTSTGAGQSERQLHTNAEEVLTQFRRPVMLNGLGDLTPRADLASRAILVTLPPLATKGYVDETAIWRDFEAARPRAFGALLNAVSSALRNLDNVKMERPPRLADFARWVAAAEFDLPWQRGRFVELYAGNREELNSGSLDADPVGSAVVRLVAQMTDELWRGTASELLERLDDIVGERARHRPDWPKAANALSSRLGRLVPVLRAAGIVVETKIRTGHGRRREIVIMTADGADDV